MVCPTEKIVAMLEGEVVDTKHLSDENKTMEEISHDGSHVARIDSSDDNAVDTPKASEGWR